LETFSPAAAIGPLEDERLFGLFAAEELLVGRCDERREVVAPRPFELVRRRDVLVFDEPFRLVGLDLDREPVDPRLEDFVVWGIVNRLSLASLPAAPLRGRSPPLPVEEMI
jgi:hypothetical protein